MPPDPLPVTTAFSWKNNRVARGAFLAIIAVAMMIVVVALGGVWKAMALQAVSGTAGAFAPVDESGHTNVLLLGVGDRTHAAPDLTDTMIVASIDRKTRSAVLLSIPRDLFLSGTEGVRDGRINALYENYKYAYRADKTLTETGASVKALESVGAEMERRLGIPIQGVIKADFTGFVNAVDTLGGVDVVVPRHIIDYTYPVKEGVTGTFEIDAGPQHLDGETALKYARSRHSSTDFDRSQRQQQVLTALMENVKAQNLFMKVSVVQSLLRNLRGHVEWTFSPGELVGLAGSLLAVKQDRIITMQLNTSIGDDGVAAQPGGFITAAPKDIAGSGDILIPFSADQIAGDWDVLRTLAVFLFDRRELYLSHPAIELVAAPGQTTQAHRLQNEFVRYGFSATTAKGTSASGGSIVASSGQSATALFLSEALKLPYSTVSAPAQTDAIRILLGPEYRFTSFQRLFSSSTEPPPSPTSSTTR